MNKNRQCETLIFSELHDNVLYYGISESPFGYCLIASSQRGICHLAFFDSMDEQQTLIAAFLSEWKNATCIRDDAKANQVVAEVFNSDNDIILLLKGTPFQRSVWQALLAIPKGQLVSYQSIADRIQKPSVVRAVASAIARNRVAYLIPCHRVIRKSGDVGGYRWGKRRKEVLITSELLM